LKDFDNVTIKLLEQAEKETTPQQKIQETHARLQLKEKQLNELAEAMKQYSPKDVLYKKYQEDAHLATDEAKRYRDDVWKKMQEEFERRKAEQRERENEKQRKLMEQFK